MWCVGDVQCSLGPVCGGVLAMICSHGLLLQCLRNFVIIVCSSSYPHYIVIHVMHSPAANQTGLGNSLHLVKVWPSIVPLT